LKTMARPEGFEPPTLRSEVSFDAKSQITTRTNTTLATAEDRFATCHIV
jgi:hypothetical protein